MNRKQTEAKGNQAEHKPGKHNGKPGTVLGEINDDEKQGSEAQVGPAGTDDAKKHRDKKDTVLGEINDDARKQKK